MKTKDQEIVHSIIVEAQKLLQQYGLNKTTMEDIAKAAGKGKSTLYYYFKSKEEIFDEVVKREMDDFFQGVKSAVDKEDNALSKLRTYITVKIKTITTKVNLYHIVKAGLLEPQLFDLYKKYRNRYDKEEASLISSILTNGIETGAFSLPEENDLNVLVEVLVSCVRGIEYDIIARDKFSTLSKRADFLVSIVAKGLQ
ncbi:TetR/AcrR family transcriptional regulator [Spirosoma luteum]|uniref:TetR/AcrR family transcriptional regulator n=1 Tax=Spirosoma luteum TaxID=431553 RepID=UPI000367397A|nr:TetR/AcrR family transcriptional regulator [Spirosoma luteum]